MKKKSTVEKANRPDLNRAQRREMAKKIREASQFTQEELIKQITEHPKSLVSVSCCVDFKWKAFMEKYGYPVPERKEGMSDEDWKIEEQAFRNFIASEKQVAMFWYVMGLNHHEEIHQSFLAALTGTVNEDNTNEGQGEQ